MNKLEITENTKGKLVYVESLPPFDNSKWLILISSASKEGDYHFIRRYISYRIDTNEWYFTGGISMCWGTSEDCVFFESTDDQKRLVAKKLASLGYKYVHILNKLIKKKKYE